MLYRLNYGNGQVSGTFKTKMEAVRERARQHEYDIKSRQPAYTVTIQFRDPDTHEWFTC